MILIELNLVSFKFGAKKKFEKITGSKETNSELVEW